MDDIDMQDEELERGDEPPTAKPMLSGWEWWPAYHAELCARRKAEREQLRALNFALDRLFDRKPF